MILDGAEALLVIGRSILCHGKVLCVRESRRPLGVVTTEETTSQGSNSLTHVVLSTAVSPNQSPEAKLGSGPPKGTGAIAGAFPGPPKRK